MTQKIESVTGQTFGNLATAGQAVRKPWQPPQIIVGTMEQAELNTGAIDDGDGGTTPDNS